MLIMMAFTLHSFKNSPLKRLGLAHWAMCRVWCLLLAVCMVPLQAQGQNKSSTQISAFKLERGADGVYLSAQIQFDLPPAVEDALLKGIPIFFVAQSELLQERWYWYDRSIAMAQRHMRLSYQPLTRRWRLNVFQGGANVIHSGQAINQNFESLEDALSAIQRISRWRVADTVLPTTDAQLGVVFNFSLDLDKLPRPFQIGNIGQSDWVIAAAAKGTVPAEISK